MKTKEALSEIIGFKKRNVSQQEIGKVLGVTKQYISQIMNKELTEEQLKLLEQHFQIDFTKVNKKEDKISVDYYPDVIASCGNGAYELSPNCIKYDVPATLFPPAKNVNGYSMCHAKGNSMYPRIWDGDFVICEHKDNMKIENGEMYIFPTQYIEKEQMNNVHLIGHVICSGRMNGQYLDRRM